MEVCVIGAGYVGLTTSAALAELGHQVICVDKNKNRIQSLKNGIIPIYEPGLQELMKKNHNRLQYSDQSEEAMKQSPIILIAVGTPSLDDGSTDLTFVHSVIDDLAGQITSFKTIITKSTVPPGTNELMQERLIQQGVKPSHFSVVSNPEFLREGSAVDDMLHPHKTVIGVQENDQKSIDLMKALYKGIDAPFVITSLNGAEMIKYASNAFLATKISFINEIARICEAYNADVTEVAAGIGLDPRIGPHFLQAGLGYGGSCFPKDVSSLLHSASIKNVSALILKAVQSINQTQVNYYIDKIKEHVGQLKSKKIAVLGIAFKPNTDDIRYSRAVKLIEELIPFECDIHAYDPKATLPIYTKGKVQQHKQMEQTIENADCVIIATDWDEIKSVDWSHAKKLMKGHILIDGRNCINPEEVQKHGLKYIGVGRT